ncbi:hypothetical protein LSAT2_017429, partial [Lamellibrachia satsuma]
AEAPLSNVASQAAATQSSSAPLGDATRAVDGGTSAIWWHGSCSCTLREHNPWWRVDLSLVHDVWQVTVTQFKELILRDFDIWLSTPDPAVSPSERSLCARYSGPPWQVAVSRIRCVQPPVRGRYVTLQAHGNNTRLVLCEVQVFAQRTGNIALGMRVSGSYEDIDLERVVDGSLDGIYSQRSCSGLGLSSDGELWWAVHLSERYNIDHVKVTNTEDAVHDHLHNITVFVTNQMFTGVNGTSGVRVCGKYNKTVGRGKTVVIRCRDEPKGEVVVVWVGSPRGFTTVCEIEVYGS